MFALIPDDRSRNSLSTRIEHDFIRYTMQLSTRISNFLHIMAEYEPQSMSIDQYIGIQYYLDLIRLHIR